MKHLSRWLCKVCLRLSLTWAYITVCIPTFRVKIRSTLHDCNHLDWLLKVLIPGCTSKNRAEILKSLLIVLTSMSAAYWYSHRLNLPVDIILVNTVYTFTNIGLTKNCECKEQGHYFSYNRQEKLFGWVVHRNHEAWKWVSTISRSKFFIHTSPHKSLECDLMVDTHFPPISQSMLHIIYAYRVLMNSYFRFFTYIQPVGKHSLFNRGGGGVSSLTWVTPYDILG
jgi:hypothetical protein